MLRVTSIPGSAMTAPNARDQQVPNHPACALSASVLTRMAAKMLSTGKAAIKTLMPQP